MKKLTKTEIEEMDARNETPLPPGSLVRFKWTKQRATLNDKEEGHCRYFWTQKQFKEMRESIDFVLKTAPEHFYDRLVVDPEYIYPQDYDYFFEKPLLVFERWELSKQEGVVFPTEEMKKELCELFTGFVLLHFEDGEKFWVEEGQLQLWFSPPTESKK